MPWHVGPYRCKRPPPTNYEKHASGTSHKPSSAAPPPGGPSAPAAPVSPTDCRARRPRSGAPAADPRARTGAPPPMSPGVMGWDVQCADLCGIWGRETPPLRAFRARRDGEHGGQASWSLALGRAGPHKREALGWGYARPPTGGPGRGTAPPGKKRKGRVTSARLVAPHRHQPPARLARVQVFPAVPQDRRAPTIARLRSPGLPST